MWQTNVASLKPRLVAGYKRLTNGDNGTLELDVRLLSPEQIARGDTGGPPPSAHHGAIQGALIPYQPPRQYASEQAVQRMRGHEQYKAQNKVINLH